MVAITSGVKNMQAVLDLVWDKLLPALKPAPLATDHEAHQKLARRLAALSLPPAHGSATPAQVSGKRFAFPANPVKLESIGLDTGDQADTLVIQAAGADQRLSCGRGQWKSGRLAFAMLTEQPVAASGAWTADGTYAARICFTETPFILNLKLKFSGNEVSLDSETNVGFGSTKRPQLVGKAK